MMKSVSMKKRHILLSTALFCALALPAAAKPRFSINTPIEKLVADPAAKALLDAQVPGLTTHPQFEEFKMMSLDALQALFAGAVPPEQVKALDKQLRELSEEKPGDGAGPAKQAEDQPK
jgi:hypothetical protein